MPTILFHLPLYTYVIIIISHLSNNMPRYVSNALNVNCKKMPQIIHNKVASIVTPKQIAMYGLACIKL